MAGMLSICLLIAIRYIEDQPSPEFNLLPGSNSDFPVPLSSSLFPYQVSYCLILPFFIRNVIPEDLPWPCSIPTRCRS